jgi:hypothetical protein
MAVTIDEGPRDGPDMIIPANEASPKRTFGEHISHIFKAFTTKDGLVGDYDYGEQPCSENAGYWLINWCSFLVHAEYSIYEQAEEKGSFFRSSGSNAGCFGSPSWIPAWLVLLYI